MRMTYPEVVFSFVDVKALADSSVTFSSAKDFSDASLYHEDIRQASYGTLELNQFVLDGSRVIFPSQEPQDVPYWSSGKSDGDCFYAEAPVLEIVFSEPHSSIGLNLYFAGDVPAEISVTWYMLSGIKITSAVFRPDSKEFFCSRYVQNYGKVTVEFIRSTLPCRYVRMDHVEYGKKQELGRNLIKAASVYEDMDPTSATLSINTAQIELVDAEGEYSLSNQAGLWKYLQKDQQIAITEHINRKTVDCGTFYLDSWSCQANTVRFSLVDILGVMDRTKFYGGKIYVHEEAGKIIDAIMESCGISQYDVREEIRGTELSGWLAIQSHRAALQQVVFACGAVADCSRSGRLRIYRPDRYASQTIGTGRKFLGTKISLDEYVSAVTVSYSSYFTAGEIRQVSEGVFPAGMTRVEFDGPYEPESLAAAGGSIVEAAVNYAVVEMGEEGSAVITGRKYDEFKSACTASVKLIEAGESPNVKTYQGCTLLDAQKAHEIAEYLLNYHQLRHVAEIRYINDGESVGSWCDVELSDGGHAATCIMHQTLDLTGGNIATMQSRGYSRVVTELCYADEIYAGERGLM